MTRDPQMGLSWQKGTPPPNGESYWIFLIKNRKNDCYQWWSQSRTFSASFPHGKLFFHRVNPVNPLFSGTIQPLPWTPQDGLLLNLGREAPNAVTRQQCNSPKWGDSATTSVIAQRFFLDELEVPTLEIQHIVKFQDVCYFDLVLEWWLGLGPH